MARKSLDDLNINESNLNSIAVVKDENGNEFVCNIEHLVPASEVDENLRSQCVKNIKPGEDEDTE